MAAKGTFNQEEPKKNTKKRVTSPELLIEAIKGSGGNKSIIARRLGVRRNTVEYKLNQQAGPEWDKVRKYYQNECESLADKAEDVVHYILKNKRKDLKEAGKTARWLLERRRAKQFGDRKTVMLEGGDKPVEVKMDNKVSLSALNLPIETRREILLAMEKKAQQAKDKEKNK